MCGSGIDISSKRNYINIYIFNIDHHIIIENKIWAGDKKAQIKHYIKTLNRGQPGRFFYGDSLIVMYL
jgi:hypothetical protein